MNTKELMIGDWVRIKSDINSDDAYWMHDNMRPGQALKVEEILSNGINPDWYGGEINDYIPEDALMPIPLTPEILGKNGFKIDKNETYCKRYFFACNLGKVPQTVVEFSFYGEGVSADTLFKCWTKPESCDGENSIHICDLKSAHELQHALRLCGIKKEIEL